VSICVIRDQKNMYAATRAIQKPHEQHTSKKDPEGIKYQ
jgi:hypothetical protein